MSTTPAKSSEFESPQPRPITGETGNTQGIIAWSGFFFALLQSICTFFVALDGFRLLIGIGSLAMATSVAAALSRFHADWIRIPMIALALLGSMVNLAVLLQIRRLRNRPAAQWRQKLLSPRKIRMERAQLALSIATLVLIGVEEHLHFSTHHHF